MIRGFFYKFNRSFKNLQNVIFHVKLLSPTLKDSSQSDIWNLCLEEPTDMLRQDEP